MGFFSRKDTVLFRLSADDLVSLPYARLIRMLILEAHNLEADQIVFGTPDGQRSGEMPEAVSEVKNSKSGFGVEGREVLPIYCRIKGVYWPLVSPVPAMFPMLLFIAEQMQVSLGNSPRRFIELDRAEPESPRRFAEVEFGMARDNSIRIYILGVHDVPEPVEVTPHGVRAEIEMKVAIPSGA